MARVYSGKKGKHGSKKPPVKITPRWAKYKKEEIEGLVVKLSKERHNTAVIGTILRDQYGVPDVKAITGKTVAKIMGENNLSPKNTRGYAKYAKKSSNSKGALE